MSPRPYLPFLFLALLPTAAAQPDSRGVAPKPPDLPSAQTEEKVALLVGIDDYPPTSGLPKLHFAAKDAADLWSVLKSKGYKSPFPDKDPVILNADANKPAIKKGIKAALDSLQGKGTFLFFFAGHGIEKNGKQYLAPREVDTDDLEGSGLDINDLLGIVKASPVQHKVLFIDACREKGTRGDDAGFSAIPDGTGTYLMYASKENQPSHEDADYQHGVFTYYLMKAFNGDAMVRGVVSFDSVETYLTRALKSDPKALGQAPRRNTWEGSGDLPLAGTPIEVNIPGKYSSQDIIDAGKQALAQKALASAEDYYRQNKYTEATEGLRVAMLLDPNNDPALSLKTKVLIATGDAAGAVAVCEERVKASSSTSHIILVLNECTLAFFLPDPEQALSYFTRIPEVARDPSLYVRLLQQANHLETLVSVLQNKDYSDLSDKPTFQLFSSYTGALKRLGDFQKLESTLTPQIAQWEKERASIRTRGVVSSPYSPAEVLEDLYFWRADARTKLGRLVAALVDYSEAMSFSKVPGTAERCWLLADLGLEAETMEECGRVGDGNKLLNLNALGQAYYHLGKPQKAVETFSAAIQLDAKEKEFFENRGYAYLLNGESDKALSDFAKAIEFDKTFPWPYRDRALTLFRLGKNEQALKDATEALRLDPYFAAAYAVRADIHSALGHTAEAGKDTQRATQLGWKPNPKLP